jgi:hypothetical protein
VPLSVLAWGSMRATETALVADAKCLLVVVNPNFGQSRRRVLEINGITESDIVERSTPRRFRYGAVLHDVCRRSRDRPDA